MPMSLIIKLAQIQGNNRNYKSLRMKINTTIAIILSLLLTSNGLLAQSFDTSKLTEDTDISQFSFFPEIGKENDNQASFLRNIVLEDDVFVYSPHDTWILSDNPNPQFNFNIFEAGVPGGDINGDGLGSIVISVDNVPDDRVTGEVVRTSKTAIFYGDNRTSTPDEFYYKRMYPIGDFDGDGYDDMLVHNGNNIYSIWYGSANGLVEGNHTVYLEIDNFTSVLGFHDITGNGKSDIFIANTRFAYSFILLEGRDRVNALQSFNLPFQHIANPNTAVYALGDITGDGKSEIITAFNSTSQENIIHIIRHTINGFEVVQSMNNAFSVFPQQMRLATGDINNDGNTEIMLMESFPSILGSLSILRKSSTTGLMQDPEVFSSMAVPVGDLNGNGRIDFIKRESDTSAKMTIAFGPADLDDGLNNDEVLEYENWNFGGLRPGMYYGDLSGDGKDNFPISQLLNTPQEINYYRDYLVLDSNDEFIFESVLFPFEDFFAGTPTVTANAGDMNGNGYDDMAIFNGSFGTLKIYFGGPDFGLNVHTVNTPSNFTALSITSGDFTGNGFSDILLGSNNGASAILIKGGTTISTTPDQTFLPGDHIAGRTAGYFFPRNIGDINGNGADDFTLSSLLINDANRNEVYIFFGGTTISSTPNLVLTPAPDAQSLVFAGFSAAALGDINGNGFNDFAIGVHSLGRGEVQIYYGNATASFSTPDVILRPSQNTQNVSGFGIQLAAADFTGNNHTDLAVLNSTNSDGNVIQVYEGGRNFLHVIDLKIPASFGIGPITQGLDYIQFLGDLSVNLEVVNDYSNSGYKDLMVNSRTTHAVAFRGVDMANGYYTPSKFFKATNPFVKLGFWGYGVGDFYGDGSQVAAMLQAQDNQDNAISSRLLFYRMSPAIELLAVNDVPNDQGYWVTVEAGGWMLEQQTVGSQSFDSWSVWMNGPSGWESRATINYMDNAASRVDVRLPSTLPTGETPDSSSPHVYEIMITAHSNGKVVATSDVLEAYALDNIAPAQLTGFDAEADNDGIQFSWNASNAHDLAQYLVWEIDEDGLIANNGVPILVTNQTSATFTDIASLSYDRFAVSAIDVHNNISEKSEIKTASVISSTEDMSGLPQVFELGQNYPNPFNPTTQIRYALPQQSNVQISVYTVTGQRVMTLVSENQSAGWYSVPFDGSNLSSGVYLYRLQTESFTETRKMLLVK